MSKILSVISDTVSNFVSSALSGLRGGFYYVSDSKKSYKRTNPLSDFLSGKINIKLDIKIEKGVILLFAFILVFVLFCIIAGHLKKRR